MKQFFKAIYLYLKGAVILKKLDEYNMDFKIDIDDVYYNQEKLILGLSLYPWIQKHSGNGGKMLGHEYSSIQLTAIPRTDYYDIVVDQYYHGERAYRYVFAQADLLSKHSVKMECQISPDGYAQVTFTVGSTKKYNAKSKTVDVWAMRKTGYLFF